MLYTKCFDTIESKTDKSVESKLLGGVSKLGKNLSGFIASTPVGDKTQIDEMLDEAGDRIGRFNDEKNRELKKALVEARDPGVIPFAESIESLRDVYARDSIPLTDGESLYLLPE